MHKTSWPVRWAGLAGLSALVGCAPLGAFHDLRDQVGALRGRTDRTEQALALHQAALAGHDASLAKLDARVGRLEKVVDWTGRFTATIAGGGSWQLIYANSSGYSQKVRIRRVTAPSPAQIRIQAVSRGAGSILSPGATPASWDFSGAGAQRWQRLACGQEIVAQSEGVAVTFEVLVEADPLPCDAG